MRIKSHHRNQELADRHARALSHKGKVTVTRLNAKGERSPWGRTFVFNVRRRKEPAPTSAAIVAGSKRTPRERREIAARAPSTKKRVVRTIEEFYEDIYPDFDFDYEEYETGIDYGETD
jgi:hypothetical protein